MSELLALLKQIGKAVMFFLAYSMGARNTKQKQEIMQKNAALKEANKVIEVKNKYETLKELAPNSWDYLRRLSGDTKHQVSAPAKTKAP